MVRKIPKIFVFENSKTGGKVSSCNLTNKLWLRLFEKLVDLRLLRGNSQFCKLNSHEISQNDFI
jgi:hypothetical protein